MTGLCPIDPVPNNAGTDSPICNSAQRDLPDQASPVEYGKSAAPALLL